MTNSFKCSIKARLVSRIVNYKKQHKNSHDYFILVQLIMDNSPVIKVNY